MDVPCRIEMLGELRVIRGDQTHTRFRTYKAGLLLAYLALNLHRTHPRERLLETFWPGMEPQVARDNLSTTLSQLRRQLETSGTPGSLILADKHQVRLRPEAVSTDVTDFERLLEQARQCEDKTEKAAALQQAVQIYRGELLPGCYEDWAIPEQTRCRLLHQENLLSLAQLWEEKGRYAEALGMAQQACAGDPFAEEGYRAQMRLLVRLKKPSAALQVYDTLEALFRQELGTRPSLPTREMAEMLRQDPRAALMMRAESAAKAQPAAPAAVVSAPVSAPSLPLQLTRFFGREQEREQLSDLLQTPGIRLVSLLGPGGAGKTRLSLEVAAQVAPHFANRVWFVPLADIPDASLIVSALTHALNLPPEAQTDPLERVMAQLGDAPCLLVLDNLEHLLREPGGAGKNDNPGMSGSVALIRLLLQRVPSLACLITSRQALRLDGERVYPLPPLALPAESNTASLERLRNNDSIALYVDRARAARPDFALTAQNAPAIAALCRRLEGMPLALEMAAAWVKTIPPVKMLERLSQQLDMLISRRRDLPPRHQSLRATIEWSYDLLDAPLQDAFARLSVFRGGWTLEAAEAVCGSNALSLLMELQEHSLIVLMEAETPPSGEEAEDKSIEEAEPRYRMLEPLREFAWEKLTHEGKAEATRHAHVAYFEQLTEEANQHYGDSQLPQWLNKLDAERDNLRAAFGWSQERDCQKGLRLAGNLAPYWHIRGRIAEGCQLIQQALAHPNAAAPTQERGMALEGLARMLNVQGKPGQAQPCAEEAAQIWRLLENKTRSVKVNNILAIIAYDLGDTTRACDLWHEVLASARAEGWKQLEATVLINLGEVLLDQEQLAQARSLFEEGLAALRALQDTERISRVLNMLGKTLLRLGEKSAVTPLAESLRLREGNKDQAGLIETLETVVEVMAAWGEKEDAARLAGGIQGWRSRTIGPRPANEEAQFAHSLGQVQASLDSSAFEAAWKQGEALTSEQTIEAGQRYLHSLPADIQGK